ncbi:hypothetical protein ABPG74_020412 [Tetrahymena malaccensis]
MQDQKVVEEQKFLSYIFNLILIKGGIKLHMSIADITKEMQALDPKDSVNHFRKRFGNMDQCLREIQNPFYTIDNHIVITFKPHDQIVQLHSQGHITEEDFKLYEKVYEENEKKKLDDNK